MAFQVSVWRSLLQGMLLTVYLTIVCLTLSVTSSSSFHKVTDRSRVALCATQPPSVVFDASQLDLPAVDFEYTPPSVLCSWKCARDPECTSFNWKATISKCELFYYVPNQCDINCGCLHYESKSCGRTSCSDDVLNITADNEIVHLFFDGCEVGSLTNAYDWTRLDSVRLPLSTEVIAVQMKNYDSVSGLLASSRLFVTDSTWKATNTYMPGWMNLRFDDSSWENTTEYGTNGAQPWTLISGISPKASWIATRNASDNVAYFRFHLKQG